MLRCPDVPIDGLLRGEGHFHLGAELFLQVAGWTRFRFPQAELTLNAGEALILPPLLMHAERVGRDRTDRPFCNVVIYAEGPVVACHLAHAVGAGRPAIQYLEASSKPRSSRVHDWLGDAARLGRELSDRPDRVRVQTRALVAAVIADVLRLLDEADPAGRPEPPLVARARALVQNQLGDPALSVQGLAHEVGCTPGHLSYVFRQVTGEHLAAFIVRQRMERAAHLLSRGRQAGKEVAWACGYSSASYFSRSFREHFGTTPRIWRAARVAASPEAA